MVSMGIPVPSGFIITTEACIYYSETGGYPEGLETEIDDHLKTLESEAGKDFGDREDPLLVSVRSGAVVSMPGMMDTVLNLGLNDVTVKGLAESTGNPRFAYDSYRRFIQMFGEVVVAGGRHPQPLAEMERLAPEAFAQLSEIRTKLESHYRDMQDIEFTIEDNTLYMLQTRTGKRTAPAALKMAVDMVREGMISKKEALSRIEPAQLDQLLHPRLDESISYDVLTKGLNASPG